MHTLRSSFACVCVRVRVCVHVYVHVHGYVGMRESFC